MYICRIILTKKGYKMKKILVIVLVLFTTLTFAQKERSLTLNTKTNLIDVVYYHDNV